MKGAVLLDTGPLVTFLAAGSEHHVWVCAQWKRLHAPLLTCEPVLTEAALLLKRAGRETDPLFELLERGVLRVGLEIEDQLADLRTLMSTVFTLDSEFRVYRRHGNKVIPVLMPEK